MKHLKISFFCIFLAFCTVFAVFCPVSASATEKKAVTVLTDTSSVFHGRLNSESFPKKAALPTIHSSELPPKTVFLGESTTTHWRIRGDLPHECVWANESGTMRLDSTLLSRRILDPENGKPIAIGEAVRQHQPAYMILSFGLNGILYFADHKDAYLSAYRKLIEGIQAESPNTEILVQTVYPVSEIEHQHNWNFSVSPAEINRKTSILNEWLAELCRDIDRVELVDTAAVLRNEAGFLPPALTCDGIHLTAEAYALIWKALTDCFANRV